MRVLTIVIYACALAASSLLHAGDIKDAARAAAEKAGASVVTVRVVASVKLNMQGQNIDQEQKSELCGTVVDPGGLTVVSASMLDPSAMLKKFLMGAKIEIAVKETTLILGDGTEVPAEVVLKDSDLDFAFIRPKEAGKTFSAVALKPRASAAKLVDDVFVVGRLGKEGNRSTAVELGTVRALVKGPRPYYVCSAEVSQNAGCMVYTADGEPLGVVVQKAPAGAGGRRRRGRRGR
jgi:S1-C subfamily serine protease